MASTSPYCHKAGISVADFRAGINSMPCKIPPYLLVNGCILELEANTRPCSWTTLTAFLRVWMGRRFPDRTNPSKVRYNTQRILNARRKIIRSTAPGKATRIQLLMEQAFTIPANTTTTTVAVWSTPIICPVESGITTPSSTLNIQQQQPNNRSSTTGTEQTLFPTTSPMEIVYDTPSTRIRFVFFVSQKDIPETQTSTATYAQPNQLATVFPHAHRSVSPITHPPESLFDEQRLTLIEPTQQATVFPRGHRSVSPITHPLENHFAEQCLTFLQPTQQATVFPCAYPSVSPMLHPPESHFAEQCLTFLQQTQQATVFPCAYPSVSTMLHPPENVFAEQCLTLTNQSEPSTSFAAMTQTASKDTHNAQLYKTKYQLTRRRERRKTTQIKTQKQTIKALKRQLKRLPKLKREKRCLQMRLKRREKSIAPAPHKKSRAIQCHIPCLQCAKYEESLEMALDESGPKKRRTIDLKKGCRYSDSVVTCVLKLLEHGVGFVHVGPVIEAALQIVNVTPRQLPSKTTVENIAKMKMPLAHLNLAASTSSLEDTTLYSDETKKYGHQYETYLVTDVHQRPKLLGLREIKDKSAATILETLQTILTDLDDIVGSEQRGAGKQILTSIKNTMSDRAATEKSFHALLKDYRREILPQVIPNWDTLSTPSREKISEIHNFYCGLHLLVNAADKCAASLKEFEFKHTGSASGEVSNAVNLIRVACTAFSRGGDDKSGCYSASSTYLAGRGIKTRLTTFRGNRFNLLFHNAAVLYHQSEHLLSFLQDCWETPNPLLQDVLNGLTSDLCMAGCRALGLLDKLLTKPLWQVIEGEGSILAMNSVYASLIENLKSCDPQTILDGSAQLIPGTEKPTDDLVFHSLTTSKPNDVLTQSILEVLVTDLTDLFQHLLKDQLPDGVNANKSPTSQPECVSPLKHNKLPETIFARLDYLQHQKPAAQIYSLESTILYGFNKVGEWLDSMSKEEQAHTLINASILRKTSMQTFKERQETLKQQRIEALKQKELEVQRRRQKALARKTAQTNNMVIHGLWQTPADVESKLKTYRSVAAKIEALKIQLNFRKNVLGQCVTDKSLFSFTVNGKRLTVAQLKGNLLTVLGQTSDK